MVVYLRAGGAAQARCTARLKQIYAQASSVEHVAEMELRQATIALSDWVYAAD